MHGNPRDYMEVSVQFHTFGQGPDSGVSFSLVKPTLCIHTLLPAIPMTTAQTH
jgi:hypothetical protein